MSQPAGGATPHEADWIERLATHGYTLDCYLEEIVAVVRAATTLAEVRHSADNAEWKTAWEDLDRSLENLQAAVES